ncbi:BNA3 [Candida jiufengensis]|uniref:BNA3 n=1 Tax=Candida jiufengensis TaxID=497108 RepID=UPI002224518A|nr:BNA3 [Candida jiufengensis]KAI5951302.1 BNA3 [Candida jiufengensis]
MLRSIITNNSTIRRYSIGLASKKMSTTTTTTKQDPASLHNPYFFQKPGQKDIWSLINETAAQAQEEDPTNKIINLGQGFFSYNPPEFAIDAVNDALIKPQFNQYAHARGNPNLLKQIAAHYSKAYGREVPIEEVQITTGANEGMFAIFFGYLTPGDEVIVFEPFFDQYIPNIEMTGAKIRYVEIKYPEKLNSQNVSGDDWEIDWETLEKSINSKTKMIVINTPHNPIGKIFTKEELHRIGELVIKNNLLLVSDEVYENLYYTPDFPRPATLESLPELRERTFTVGSAGKSFAATGWRIGYIQGPAPLIKYVTAAHTRICFSTPAPLQQAVSQAFSQVEELNYFEKVRSDYVKKYKIFTEVFDELGLPYTKAQGGYFLLVNLSKLKIPKDYKFPQSILDRKTLDFKLAYWLIKEIGVVGIPPTEFLIESNRVGNGVENCIRFAVCKDDSILKEAVEKLKLLKNYL